MPVARNAVQGGLCEYVCIFFARRSCSLLARELGLEHDVIFVSTYACFLQIRRCSSCCRCGCCISSRCIVTYVSRRRTTRRYLLERKVEAANEHTTLRASCFQIVRFIDPFRRLTRPGLGSGVCAAGAQPKVPECERSESDVEPK